MLTSDYTLTHMTGYKQSRAEWLQQVKSGEMRYFETREVSVQPNMQGDSAVLVGRAYTKADIWGIQGTWGLQLTIDFRRERNHFNQCIAAAYETKQPD